MQKSKSTTAAEATYDINPDLQVEAHLNKLCPATESIYNDSFFSRMNVVVTALDNVEARRYVDRSVQWMNECSRCSFLSQMVTFLKSLSEFTS